MQLVRSPVRHGNNGVTELRSVRHMEFRQDRAKSFRSGNYAVQCPLNNRGSAIICEAARSRRPQTLRRILSANSIRSPRKRDCGAKSRRTNDRPFSDCAGDFPSSVVASQKSPKKMRTTCAHINYFARKT